MASTPKVDSQQLLYSTVYTILAAVHAGRSRSSFARKSPRENLPGLFTVVIELSSIHVVRRNGHALLRGRITAGSCLLWMLRVAQNLIAKFLEIGGLLLVRINLVHLRPYQRVVIQQLTLTRRVAIEIHVRADRRFGLHRIERFTSRAHWRRGRDRLNGHRAWHFAHRGLGRPGSVWIQ